MRKKIKLNELTTNIMSAFFTKCKGDIPIIFISHYFIILRYEIIIFHFKKASFFVQPIFVPGTKCRIILTQL